MGELREKIGVLCFAYFTLASAKSPCFLTKEPGLQKGSIIQINFRSALTLVDSAIADSSESDCELQTPAEARF